MRLPFLKYLLPLFLLFAQQEALLHEIGHYGEAIKFAESPDKKAPEGKPCEKCVAFANIAGAVHSDAAALITPDLTYDQPQQATSISIAAEVPSPRNRGPPLFL
jgi:hypothetical protein